MWASWALEGSRRGRDGVAGDGEIEGRIEGRGGVDCKSGSNKLSRLVDSEPTVMVDAALMLQVDSGQYDG